MTGPERRPGAATADTETCASIAEIQAQARSDSDAALETKTHAAMVCAAAVDVKLSVPQSGSASVMAQAGSGWMGESATGAVGGGRFAGFKLRRQHGGTERSAWPAHGGQSGARHIMWPLRL